MKRRFIMLLAASLAVFMLAGCGDKKKEKNGTQEIEDHTQDTDENTDDSDADGSSANVTLKDFDAETFVTLGEYKGLEVTVPRVEEAKLQEYVENTFLNSLTAETGVTDRAVEDGDMVFISYVGTLDGEAFGGGTSDGTFLEIGSGSYIDGFEEGLIGVMPGETVELNLKFPDPYNPNPDMSGAETVFSVTVIYIVPEMSDEVIQAMENDNFSNVEELNQYIYDLMVNAEGSEDDYNLRVENAVIEKLLNNCVFGTLPQNLVNKYTQNIMYNLSIAAAGYGYDVDTYTSILYGMNSSMIASQFGEDSAKQGLVFQVIANLEDLNVTDEELDAQLQQYVEDYGLSSIEEFLGDTDKEDYRDFFMFDKVIAYLIENAVISEE